MLGSTFPNVGCRDEALGLKQFVRGAPDRGLRSPWASENHEYWDRLQTIVNHARTFVFESVQGQGIGIAAHKVLPTNGVSLWRERYQGEITALDTLCDSSDSGLFRRNGWAHVGRTKGFGSNSKTEFGNNEGGALRNNVGLGLISRPWEVWVREVD